MQVNARRSFDHGGALRMFVVQTTSNSHMCSLVWLDTSSLVQQCLMRVITTWFAQFRQLLAMLRGFLK